MAQRLFCLLVLAAALCSASLAHAAITAEQRQELGSIGSLITKAGSLYTNKKYDDAGKSLKEAQEKLEKLAASGDKQVLDALASLHSKLNKAHGLMELEGITLPALKSLDEMSAKPAAGGGKPAAGAPAGGGSVFVSQIVPILIGKCGRCHVQDDKGKFSMSTIENLKKGQEGAGVVIFPKDPDGSRIIETIVSGEMPRGGLKVTAEELATLKKWIADGADYGGVDPKALLVSLSPNAKPVELPKVTVQQATGKETVSFARDIAPVLAASCNGCHGTERPRENFSVNTFERLLAGGDQGAVIVPGKPNDSLLVKKLEGTGGGARMPQNQSPLATDVIAKVRKWIEEGGKFDGPDTKMAVTRVASLARAMGATHEQLSEDRRKLADDHWRLVMPGIDADKAETEHFLVLGNVGPKTLEEFGKAAEVAAPKVGELFKHSSDKPLVKGRMTLFVFKQRYDYSEFGKMVERRDLPPESRGHWHYGVVEAYGAMVMPTSADNTLTSLVAQQLGGTYISSLGKSTPHWFGEGCGRVAAARLDPKDARVIKWESSIPEVVSMMNSSDDFITGKLPGEATDIAAYSFVKFLMQDSKKFNLLLDGLRKGGDFGQTFSVAYGGAPNQVTDAWIRKAASKKK